MSFVSQLKLISKKILPPIAVDAVRTIRGTREKSPAADPHGAEMDSFYGSLVPPNSLCFDIGANIGNRIVPLRSLGLSVVALEPQPHCFSILNESFGADQAVRLVNKAAGSALGKATMMVSNTDVLSTLSQSFIDATIKSGRFEHVKWDKTIEVEVVTLDALIAQYGVPYFIKIDVEGFELEVVRGLSRPISLISLEWAPEMTDNLIACVEYLSKLGPISCNLSWGESMRLARTKWMDKDRLFYTLNALRDETYLFGDIYIRSANLS